MTHQNALFCFTYGLYVIGAKTDTGFAGCIVDAVMQTTCTPPTFVMACIKNNATPQALLTHPDFTLSVLPKDVDPFVIANFGFQSSRNVDKWSKVPHILVNGLPVLKQNVAYVRAHVRETKDLGTHLLFFCDVLSGDTGSDSESLSYTYYQQHLKQKTVDAFKRGPVQTFVPQTGFEEKTMNDTKETAKKEEWVCSVCGYVYDGDVPFEELPDDYVCPICAEPKSVFVKQ